MSSTINIQLELDLEVNYLFYTPVHHIIYHGKIRVNIQMDLNLFYTPTHHIISKI